MELEETKVVSVSRPRPRLPLYLELAGTVLALGLGALAALVVLLMSYGESGSLGLPIELTSPLAGATLGVVAAGPLSFSRGWGVRGLAIGAGAGALVGVAVIPFV